MERATAPRHGYLCIQRGVRTVPQKPTATSARAPIPCRAGAGSLNPTSTQRGFLVVGITRRGCSHEPEGKPSPRFYITRFFRRCLANDVPAGGSRRTHACTRVCPSVCVCACVCLTNRPYSSELPHTKPLTHNVGCRRRVGGMGEGEELCCSLPPSAIPTHLGAARGEACESRPRCGKQDEAPCWHGPGAGAAIPGACSSLFLPGRSSG